MGKNNSKPVKKLVPLNPELNDVFFKYNSTKIKSYA